MPISPPAEFREFALLRHLLQPCACGKMHRCYVVEVSSDGRGVLVIDLDYGAVQQLRVTPQAPLFLPHKELVN